MSRMTVKKLNELVKTQGEQITALKEQIDALIDRLASLEASVHGETLGQGFLMTFLDGFPKMSELSSSGLLEGLTLSTLPHDDRAYLISFEKDFYKSREDHCRAFLRDAYRWFRSNKHFVKFTKQRGHGGLVVSKTDMKKS